MPVRRFSSRRRVAKAGCTFTPRVGVAGYGHQAPAPVKFTEARMIRPTTRRVVFSDTRCPALRARLSGRASNFYCQGQARAHV
jgi:hypothetical protein